MHKPKITVLMPVYNTEKYISSAIESILSQTFKNFEYIIINDASTDTTKDKILYYKDTRIIYLENAKNIGVAGTLNIGLKKAKGKYIARMDADDIALPERLKLQYHEFNKDKFLVVLASGYDAIDKTGNFLYQENDPFNPEKIYYTLQFRNCLGHPTVMFNRKIILTEFGGYDELHEAEDYSLWLKISKRYKILKINKSLLKLRLSDKSRIGLSGIKINKDALIIAKKNIELLIKKHIPIKTVQILAGQKYLNRRLDEIMSSIKLLEEINSKIVTNAPDFLSKSIIQKHADERIFNLEQNLIIIKIINFKFLRNYKKTLKSTYRAFYKFKGKLVDELSKNRNKFRS